jgi:hypothetical protein
MRAILSVERGINDGVEGDGFHADVPKVHRDGVAGFLERTVRIWV